MNNYLTGFIIGLIIVACCFMGSVAVSMARIANGIQAPHPHNTGSPS